MKQLPIFHLCGFAPLREIILNATSYQGAAASSVPRCWVAVLLAAAVGAGAADSAPAHPATADPVAPILARFSPNLLLHAGFDAGSAAADLATGPAAPRRIEGEVGFAPGLTGQALANGVVHYEAAGNLRLDLPGTVLLWISISRTDPDAKGEGYLFPLRILGGDAAVPHGLLMIGKLDRVNGCGLYTHVEATGQKQAQIHDGSTLGWKAAEWHLLALTWRKEAIEFSVDGALPQMAAAPRLPATGNVILVAAASDPNSGLTCLLDEVLILDRPLDKDEMAWVYRSLRPPAP